LSEFQNDIVYAVFARAAALSQGPDAERAVLREAAAAGLSSASLVAQRLRFFEKHRNEYPTLNTFMPLLIRGLNLVQTRQAKRSTGSANIAAKPQQCGIAQPMPPLAAAGSGSIQNALGPARSGE
jgi:hypothetical protein